jgi:hypothetical protein
MAQAQTKRSAHLLWRTERPASLGWLQVGWLRKVCRVRPLEVNAPKDNNGMR